MALLWKDNWCTWNIITSPLKQLYFSAPPLQPRHIDTTHNPISSQLIKFNKILDYILWLRKSRISINECHDQRLLQCYKKCCSSELSIHHKTYNGFTKISSTTISNINNKKCVLKHHISMSYCLSWFCSEIFALSSEIFHGPFCYLSPREMLNKRSQTNRSCQIRTEGHVPSSHCLIFIKTSKFLITPGLFCLTWYEIHLVCYQLGACCILSFLSVECAGQGHNNEVWLDHMGGHEWGEEASGSERDLFYIVLIRFFNLSLPRTHAQTTRKHDASFTGRLCFVFTLTHKHKLPSIKEMERSSVTVDVKALFTGLEVW